MVNTVVKKDDIRELCVSYVISDREAQQEASGIQRQQLAVANKQIDAATVITENAKSKCIEATDKFIAANDTHQTAIAEFYKVDSRAEERSSYAKQANDEVRRLTDKLNKLSQRYDAQTVEPAEDAQRKHIEDVASLEEDIRQAKEDARQAIADASKAEADARQAEAIANREEVSSTTAGKRRDLACEVASAEKQDLEKLQARRDKLEARASNAVNREDIGAVAESICRQVILPGGSEKAQGR